uniref:Uncharacterized protein n=1 Tax=Oryza barthii TaxID=65489 RepID=A0A0D3FTS2_9ORYZ
MPGAARRGKDAGGGEEKATAWDWGTRRQKWSLSRRQRPWGRGEEAAVEAKRRAGGVDAFWEEIQTPPDSRVFYHSPGFFTHLRFRSDGSS